MGAAFWFGAGALATALAALACMAWWGWKAHPDAVPGERSRVDLADHRIGKGARPVTGAGPKPGARARES